MGMCGSPRSLRPRIVCFSLALHHTLTRAQTGGAYIGFDGAVHTTPPGQTFYSDMSLWDTHRSQNPLLVLLRPDVARDIAASLVLMADQGGALPRWPLAHGYTGCMISSHGIQVLADTALKGIGSWDIAGAQRHAVNMMTNPALDHGLGCLGEFMSRGYCASESDRTGTCLTLSYAFDSHAAAVLSMLVNASSDAARLLQQARSYENAWSPGDRFMCPRNRAGLFDCPPGTTDVFDEHYVEGDEWQWRWFVPHDPEGLGALRVPEVSTNVRMMGRE